MLAMTASCSCLGAVRLQMRRRRTGKPHLIEQVADQRLFLHQRHELGAVRAPGLQRLHLLLKLTHLRPCRFRAYT